MVELYDFLLLTFCFSYPPVRSRLELLMGTNVVRLTDRKYMLKLMARIRQDHEKNQEARIQDRKHRELMRTKKMILDRFIPVEEAPIEIRQYPLFQLYCYCDAIFEQRRKKPKLTRTKIQKSAYYQLLYPRKSSVDEVSDGEEEEVPMKEIMVDGELQLVPLTSEEIEEATKEREVAEDIANGYMYTNEEYDNLHYEADSVKKLKETKTVNEMYARAYEIVGALTTFSSDEKRKRCTMDQPASPPSSPTTLKADVQVK